MSTRIRHDLNGLRGIAIALVVVFHVWFGRVSGGVDVFLVLTGFFFGHRLLRLIEAGSPLSLRGEITRLLRRLLPALVLVLVVCAALTIAVQPQTRWETFADHSLASLGYYQNWELADTAGDYLAAGEAVSPLQHLWSMSVQGQFLLALLLIAWLLALASARLPSNLRRGVFVATVGAATVVSFCYANLAHAADQSSAYYDTFARAWEPLAGVVAAAVLAGVAWPIWLRTVAAVVGLAAILSCGVLIDGVREYPASWALVPVGATVLLICAGANVGDNSLPRPSRFLASSPLVTLGAIAYALYLWHWPVLIFWLARNDRDTAGLLDGAAVIALSVLLAWLTLNLVEDPLRGRGSRRSPSHAMPERTAWRPALVMGVVLACASLTLVVGSLGWRSHVSAIRASGTELTSLPAVDYPGGRALVEHLRVAKLPPRPSVLEAPEDRALTSLDGCITDFLNTDLISCDYGDVDAVRTIALAGGSHSEHWIAALDILGRQHGFVVRTYLKMGCPLTTDEAPVVAGSLEPYPECAAWIGPTMAQLIADKPDYVFMTTTRPYTDKPGDFVPDNYLGIWDELGSNGISILGVRDTPWMFRDGMLFSPLDCLADGGEPDTCGLPRSEALADDNPTLEYLDRYPMLLPLDLSDAVCAPDVCRAVEGNVTVYNDEHHLSATYVRTLVDELGRQVSEATGWW